MIIVICAFICGIVNAQEMTFYGIPFGSEQRVFNSKLMDNGFKWITGTVQTTPPAKSKAELRGDFWKAKDCTLYLFSYNPDTFKKSYPITEAWVIIPVQDSNMERIYEELVNDFVKKYGSYIIYKNGRDCETEWHLNNGIISVRKLLDFAIRVEYVSSIRLRQLEEENRFKGNGSNDL